MHQILSPGMRSNLRTNPESDHRCHGIQVQFQNRSRFADMQPVLDKQTADRTVSMLRLREREIDLGCTH
jgi:hypothetical protein